MSGAAAMLCLPCKACSSGRGRIAEGRAGNTPRLAWCDSTGEKTEEIPSFRVLHGALPSVDDSGRPVDKRGFLRRRREPRNEIAWWRRKNCGTNGGASRMGSGASRDRHTEGMVERMTAVPKGRRRAGIFAGLVAVAAGLVFVLAAATASLPGSNFEIDGQPG